MPSLDVVTIGETMIRLSPPDSLRLEQAVSLECSIGGTESNFAVALSRLGMKSAWISRLVDNPLGRRIAAEIRGQGVDTSRIIWTKEGRVGVYFIEFGRLPRASQIIYDRKDSAVSQVTPEEVDWEFVKSARILHLTGITPALSESCHQVVLRAIEEAKKANMLISFDINYRSLLWSPEEAKATLEEIIPEVDIFLSSIPDACLVLKAPTVPEEAAEYLKDRYNIGIVALTLGGEGSLAYSDKMYRGRIYEAYEVDRVGAGDAFDAGFIYGYLTKGVQKGLDYGGAMASLKYSIAGDMALLILEEIEELLEGRVKGIKR